MKRVSLLEVNGTLSSSSKDAKKAVSSGAISLNDLTSDERYTLNPKNSADRKMTFLISIMFTIMHIYPVQKQNSRYAANSIRFLNMLPL